MAAADVGEPRDVYDAQMRIGGGFADDELGPGRDRRLHRRVVAGGHLAEHHAKSSQMLAAEFTAAVVALVEKDDLLAGIQMGHQQADQCRHAAGIEHGRLTPLDRCQFIFDDPLAGIAVATVLLAGLLLLDEVDDRLRVAERVRARREDRIGDREARLLPCLAGMHGRGGRAEGGGG